MKKAYRESGIKGFWQAQIDLNDLGKIPSLDNNFLAGNYFLLGESAIRTPLSEPDTKTWVAGA